MEQSECRNDGRDETKTFFDTDGQWQYSIRQERVSDTHWRRYYNGELVYEAHVTAEGYLPVSVQYFYQGGKVMIDFTPGESGKGQWRLYDEGGLELRCMTVNHDESLLGGMVFLRRWDRYFAGMPKTDWEMIRERFDYYYDRYYAALQLGALPVPAILQQAYENVGLDNDKLMRCLKGYLSADEEMARMAGYDFWDMIEEDGAIFDEGYKTAILLLRVLPHYGHLPVVQHRLVWLLYSILELSDIRTYHEGYYAEVIKSLRNCEPVLMQFAKDKVLSGVVMYILSHSGTTAGEDFLKAIWQQEDGDVQQRAMAICALGLMYDFRGQMPGVFVHSLLTEQQPFLRFVLALVLVSAYRMNAHDSWLEELVQAFVKHEELQADYPALYRFFKGRVNVRSCVLLTLYQSKRGPQLKVVLTMIDGLAALEGRELSTEVQTILYILYKGEVPADMVHIRQQTLLSIAEIVAKKPDIVTQVPAFRHYDLPLDESGWRKLANLDIEK